MRKRPYDNKRRLRYIRRVTLNSALNKVARGDVQPLARYLRAGGPVSRKADLHVIADLIDPPKKNTRTTKRTQSIRTGRIARVRALERASFRKNPNTPFYRVRRKLIARVFASPFDDGEFGFAEPITEDEIYVALNRGGTSQKNKH